MAKILGISGSPRKSATYRSLELALEAAKQNNSIQTEIISLSGKNLKPCNHCNWCKRENKLCRIEDYMKEMYPKIIEADAFIFASPVYVMNVTPQLHALFTRMRPLMKPKGGILRNKIVSGIAVGGVRNGGQEITINAIAHAAYTRGMIFVGNEPGNYSGAMIWSKDQGAKGVEEDNINVESLQNLGARLAEVVLLFEMGKKNQSI